MYKLTRQKRHKSIRKNVVGSAQRPRLSVFRSHQHIYAQIIDDTKGQTLVSESDLTAKSGTKKEKALTVGENIAKKAVQKKIKQVVFDRGGFIYHGRVAALTEGARKGGLEF
jgi:large subunit ribosomal protein L18